MLEITIKWSIYLRLLQLQNANKYSESIDNVVSWKGETTDSKRAENVTMALSPAKI